MNQDQIDRAAYIAKQEAIVTQQRRTSLRIRARARRELEGLSPTLPCQVCGVEADPVDLTDTQTEYVCGSCTPKPSDRDAILRGFSALSVAQRVLLVKKWAEADPSHLDVLESAIADYIVALRESK